ACEDDVHVHGAPLLSVQDDGSPRDHHAKRGAVPQGRRSREAGARPARYRRVVALPSAADLLKAQLRHAWVNVRWVLEDLREEEYFWEATPRCWSIRRRAPGVRGWGQGGWVCENEQRGCNRKGTHGHGQEATE